MHLFKGGKIESNLFGVRTFGLFLTKCLSGYVGELLGGQYVKIDAE